MQSSGAMHVGQVHVVVGPNFSHFCLQIILSTPKHVTIATGIYLSKRRLFIQDGKGAHETDLIPGCNCRDTSLPLRSPLFCKPCPYGSTARSSNIFHKSKLRAQW